MKTTEEPVIIEEAIGCSRLALWDALVNRDEMVQWFFADIPEFKPEVGFYTEFTVDTGEKEFLHQWEVTEVDPGEKIAYRWRYAGYPGAAQSVFEVSGDFETSRLRLSFVLEEDFPDDVPEFTRDACVGGWTYFIGELKNYFEG